MSTVRESYDFFSACLQCISISTAGVISSAPSVHFSNAMSHTVEGTYVMRTIVVKQADVSMYSEIHDMVCS